jgi:hypothetical protein
MRVLILCLGIVLLSLNTGFSQKKLFGFKPLTDTVSEEKKGFFMMPLIYYTPDTRWAFGGAGVYYFKIQPKLETEKETRVSYVQFLSDYTQNKQLDVWGIWNIFTRNENYLLKGELRYRNFPDRFYGIGNNTPKSNEEKYSYSLVSVKNLVMRKVKRDLFLGLDYHFEYEYGFTYTTGGLLEQGTITGYKGGVGSALGFVGVFDSRDNAINAFRGKLIEVSSYVYVPPLGSTFTFVGINGLYQQHWSFRKKQVLAVQSKLRLSYGEVPFLDMSTVGSDDLVRGYPKNRFRDNHFLGAQIEYRRPLFWRFGMVAFAGFGDVFKQPVDLNLSRLKYSIGTGLRFVVNPAERLNIRFDYAWGKEGGHYYFSVAEAF